MPSTRKSGFIQMIIIFIILVAIISYFNINVRGIVESDTFQWGLGLAKGLWQNYVSPAINFIFGYFEKTKV
ncbi:MAG: hypothetical protein HZB09_01795 [Candidatus Yonathbacteria bacterium]|nr:hypothetical protein [Candidatus Yonathbacteria bacterium]